jgi:2-polyprenyl-6-hydroxyphenyl methylase/3-demethylubiquinone-9 3-methyltransferase
VNSDSHPSDPRFVEYYERASATEHAVGRAIGIMRAVLKARRAVGASVERLQVADIGCNAGTQSIVWLEGGHSVKGLDINGALVEIARQRSRQFAGRAEFAVGSATRLPWASGSFDVCLLPELLEHVDDWRSCITEAARLLGPGGTIYLSTSNVLCPIQNEYALPGYSWYPAPLKRYFVARATTRSPALVKFASYPAVHWFNPYSLRKFLEQHSLATLDRFDLVDVTGRGTSVALLLKAIRTIPPLRFAGHVLSPSTILVGHKRA